MSSLTLGWEYLTGYAVATDPSSRDHAEWPPHPGRVFMALAAAWFETEPPAKSPRDDRERRAWQAEGDALRWLETLDDPELHLPRVDIRDARSNVTVYVPVNDKADAHSQPDKKKKATIYPHLGSVAIGRNKQARTFPRVWVGPELCSMHWSTADGVEQHVDALDRLCRKVTRIGHSSSLVRMWTMGEGEPACVSTRDRWSAGDGLADHQVRTICDGALDMLTERFNGLARERHAELMDQIEALTARKKIVKGKGSKERKAEMDHDIQVLKDQAGQINPRPPVRPSLGLWSGYQRGALAEPDEGARTCFDTDVLVLTHVEGPRLPVVSILAVTRALRNTIMSESGVQPVPSWVSGHEPNGQPLRSENDGHLAIIPLPFVGSEHADGHLLGVGLVFPRSVDRRERGRVLGKLLVDEQRLPRNVELRLGRLGVWTVRKRDWSETRGTLAPETWTGQPRRADERDGADTWASVTPVVLDKFPRSDRSGDRLAWTDEVAKIIAAACVRIGLPEPVEIDIDTTSWQLGSPRATCKRRVLRGHAGSSRDADAALGDGFPPFPAKGTNAPRPQVHVWMQFAEPVVGPVLLGAGRYLGYGLCKPWKPLKEDRR